MGFSLSMAPIREAGSGCENEIEALIRQVGGKIDDTITPSGQGFPFLDDTYESEDGGKDTLVILHEEVAWGWWDTMVAEVAADLGPAAVEVMSHMKAWCSAALPFDIPNQTIGDGSSAIGTHTVHHTGPPANPLKSFLDKLLGKKPSAPPEVQDSIQQMVNQSRLVATTGVTSSSYAYNGLDARIAKSDSSGNTQYRRDGASVSDPVLGDGSASYTPGISESRSGTSRFLHGGIKNGEARTTSQALDSTRTYDGFGNIISSIGSWQGPFGYGSSAGYQEDSGTGLKLLGHRYYDSTIGRFLSRDPSHNGRNWYTYCSNAPLTCSDGSGYEEQELSAKEKRIVQRQIDKIRAAGNITAADKLQKLLDKGRILTEELDPGDQAVTREWTTRIVISKALFDRWRMDDLHISVAKKKAQSEADLRVTELWFQATLMHELEHTMQGTGAKTYIYPEAFEDDARAAALRYIMDRKKRGGLTPSEKEALDTAEQDVIDNWRTMNPNYNKTDSWKKLRGGG